MDTRYLNYIITIAEKENMTKAAEELFVSQSTLSQYLAKLESDIGTPLFMRSKGRLTLTQAGVLYIDSARKIVSIKNNLYQNINSLSNRGHITIGVTSQFALDMLTQIIPDFKNHFPEITIEISETNVPALTRLIQEENIDCGIMALNVVEPFAPEQVTILRHEEVYFAVPIAHPYRSKNSGSPIPLTDFSANFTRDHILLAKKGATLRHLTDQVLQNGKWIPNTICETNSITATRSMVAMGMGVAFIGESCATDREHIAYYSIDPPLYRLNAFVTRKNWAMTPSSTRLCSKIMGFFRE